jgi:hypothetical protein
MRGVEAARKLARVVLLAAGAAVLAGGLAGVVAGGSIEAAYELAYGDGGAARGRAAVVVGALLAVAAAGCCGYAAEQLRVHGRRGAVWLVCALLAGGLSPALFGAGTIIAPRIVGAGASAVEIGADVAAVAPRWYVPAVAGLATFGVCAAVVVAMLVAVPRGGSD